MGSLLRRLAGWLLRRPKPGVPLPAVPLRREPRPPARIFQSWVYAADPLLCRGPSMAGDDLPDDGIMLGEVNADLSAWAGATVPQQDHGRAVPLPRFAEQRNDALLRIEWEKGELARLAAEHQAEIANRKVA